MNKRTLLSAAGLAACAALTLSACGGGSTPGAASTTPPPATTAAAPTTAAPTTETSAPETTAAPTTESSSAPAPTETSSAPGAPAAGELKEQKASSDTVTDKVLGDTIKVTGIAWGFTGSGTWATPPAGATYVAVKYAVTAGEKYYTSATCNNLLLKTSEMNQGTTNVTTSVKADMVKQGLEPFDSPDPGKSAEGYCVYYVKNPSETNLSMVYSRLGLKGGGKTYPAVEEEHKITVG